MFSIKIKWRKNIFFMIEKHFIRRKQNNINLKQIQIEIAISFAFLINFHAERCYLVIAITSRRTCIANLPTPNVTFGFLTTTTTWNKNILQRLHICFTFTFMYLFSRIITAWAVPAVRLSLINEFRLRSIIIWNVIIYIYTIHSCGLVVQCSNRINEYAIQTVGQYRLCACKTH